MSPSADDMQTLLATARAVGGPDRHTIRRMRTGIDEIDPGCLPEIELPPALSGGTAPATGALVWAKVAVAVLACATAIALGVGGGSNGAREPSAAASQSRYDVSMPDTHSAPAVAFAPTIAAPSPPETHAIDAPVARPVPRDQKPRRSRSRSPERRQIAPALATTEAIDRQLPDEVALIGLARTSVNRGKPARALQLVNDYRKRFPTGALEHEATVVEILGLCALGRDAEARATSAGLGARAGDVYVHTRLQRSCVGER